MGGNMKSIMLTVLLTTAVLGAEPKPLITKVSGGGFTIPEYAGYERCELFADKVVITNQLGMHVPTALQLVETRTVSISGDIQKVIELSKAEKVSKKPNNLCDGPSTHISANLTGEAEPVLLFSTGGCGSPRLQREGANAQKLRTMVDSYCPKTYDFSDPE